MIMMNCWRVLLTLSLLENFLNLTDNTLIVKNVVILIAQIGHGHVLISSFLNWN